MTAIQTVYLKQTEYGVPPVIHAVQNDTGRTLKMILDDVTVENTDTAVVSIHRPDNSFYTVNATKVYGENAFKIDMTQALTQVGIVECQLKVASSEKIVSTYTFNVFVQETTDGYPSEQLGYTVEDIMEAIDEVVDYVDELQDIRNGYDGTQYPTAGDSVRSQIISALIQGGISNDLKQALLNAFSHVAWVDEYGQDYYDALEDALYPPATLLYITADFNQGSAVIYDSDSLDDIKQYLTVTAYFNDGTSPVVTSYTLSGQLVAGTSRITATYEGRTAVFSVQVTLTPGTISIINNLTNANNSNSATSIQEGESYSATITPIEGCAISSVLIKMGSVDVTSIAYDDGDIYIAEVSDTIEITVVAIQLIVTSISAVYTQSGYVYETDTIDSLKDDLVVTASYNIGPSRIVTDYTLSGTLAIGTSTITVSYGGKTTTFTVVVTEKYPLPTGYTKYDYVESDGGSTPVNTGVGYAYCAPAYEHEIKFTILDEFSDQAIWGARNDHFGGNWTKEHTFWSQPNGKIGIHAYGEHPADIGQLVLGTPVTMKTYHQQILIDDVVIYTSTGTGVYNATLCEVAIFGYGWGSSSTSLNGSSLKMRVYGYSVKDENGDYIALLTPCTNPSNVAGFYDHISQTFKTSSSPTHLSCGNDA